MTKFLFTFSLFWARIFLTFVIHQKNKTHLVSWLFHLRILWLHGVFRCSTWLIGASTIFDRESLRAIISFFPFALVFRWKWTMYAYKITVPVDKLSLFQVLDPERCASGQRTNEHLWDRIDALLYHQVDNSVLRKARLLCSGNVACTGCHRC